MRMGVTMVLWWVVVGVFNALIATHLVKDRRYNSGVSNLAVGVFGALLGGLLMYAIVGGGRTYAAFLARSVSAMLVSAFVIKVTRLLNRPDANARVS
jgi:uncharacterized membrane protein YeaQ/YmgE (transglycosylase-associated protein family)